jgi:thiamine biosynthesis lipoprotein
VKDAYRQSSAVMGTVVTMDVIDRPGEAGHLEHGRACVARAFDWFLRVETCASRFDPASELLQLSSRIGEAVPVSPLLFEAVRFALAVAADTGGALDPTVGHVMEARGFNREHRTGRTVRTGLTSQSGATYRDVELDSDRQTITLHRPLVLDLGAVAKGMAIDLAARELASLENFAIDAGGDLYLAGTNRAAERWRVGIRHPRQIDTLIASLRISDAAVCTSGDYLRRTPVDPAGHHVLVPSTGRSAGEVASVTVVAASAMLADALATAAFVLGPREGIRLLERHGVEGLIVSPDLKRFATQGMGRDSTILSYAEGAADRHAGGPDRDGDVAGRRHAAPAGPG